MTTDTLPAPSIDREAPTSPHHDIPEPMSQEEMFRAVLGSLLDEKLAPIERDMRELCETFTERSDLLSTQVMAMNASLEMATNAYRLHAERTDATIAHQDGRIKTLEATVEVQKTEIATLKTRVATLEAKRPSETL